MLDIQENKAVAVHLWGEIVGYLSWEGGRSQHAIFAFEPSFLSKGWDISPIQYSIHSPYALLPKTGSKDKLYHGLPPFIADSLPDKWGQKVLQQWLEKAGLAHLKMNPLLHLCYIGRRGMGALEYEPAYKTDDVSTAIEADKLFAIAEAIQQERQAFLQQFSNELLLQDLFQVSTSPGGRRAKAIIGMNAEGVILSGQTNLPEGFKHYILKFNDDKSFPFCEVEMAYYRIAQQAGITMMPSQLLSIEGKWHFLTERFDRQNGEKIHMLSLAGLNPLVDSYEGIFDTCRALHISAKQQEDLFRRMVFNVIGGNVDDHSKNFSFLMNKNGQWSLAPAYDMVFSMDLSAPHYVNQHALSINNKVDSITIDDLRYVGRMNDIKNVNQIIEQVRYAFSMWETFAHESHVPDQWIEKINNYLHISPKTPTFAAKYK